jgi:Rrf2 family transcriptional regulator, cysteine metabolism repressor
MRGNLFSAKAEYACIAMLELALRHGDPQPIRLKTIADAHGIPKRFLVQILLQLKGAGLIASTRGASGGYHLSRAPENITLADIIGVIDRSDSTAPPRQTGSIAHTALGRSLRSVWAEIVEAQQRVLEGTTLADLVQRSQASFDLIYQI